MAMPRTLSSPSTGKAKPSRSLGTAVGLDLGFDPMDTTVSEFYSPDFDRSRLPIGVTRSMALRMRIDCMQNPVMLDLRMNNQNLRNELILHKGKIISSQFSLMKPRPQVVSWRPQPTVTHRCDEIKAAKLSKMLKAQQENELGKEQVQTDDAPDHVNVTSPTSPKALVCKCGSVFAKDADSCRKCGLARPNSETATVSVELPEDPEIDAQIKRLLKEGRLEAMYKSREIVIEGFGTGFPHNKVERCLSLMGFYSLDEKKVKEVVNLVARGSRPLSLDELAKIVAIFDIERTKELHTTFAELDKDQSGTVSSVELRHLLWDRGCSVSMHTVEDIVREVDSTKSGSGDLDFEDFTRALRIVTERHGFTQEEMNRLYGLFDKYDMDGSGEISADELASLLGYFGTPTTTKQAVQIVKLFDTDGDGALGKMEFLSVMRLRLEDEISDMRSLFAECDSDHSGCIDAEEVVSLLHMLNYSVLPDVVLEVIRDTVGSPESLKQGLVFEDLVKVIHRIREQEGFSRAEVAELQEVFKKHDSRGNGELREFEVTRALDWLGYPLSHAQRRHHFCKVDVDKTDSIDRKEFLKYIRILREEEVSAANALLASHTEEEYEHGEYLRINSLRAMLNKLGYIPSPALIEEAVKQSSDGNDDGIPDLVGVLGIFRFIREKQVAMLRQSSGLSDNIANKVRMKASRQAKGALKLTAEEVEKVIIDTFNAGNSPEDIAEVKKVVAKHCIDGKMNIDHIFQVARKYDDERDKASWRREQNAAKAAGFSPTQVAQFRNKFVNSDTDGSGFLSDQEIQQIFDDVLRLNSEQINILQRELNSKGAVQEWVDFSEFLRLMRIVSVTGNE